jgi:transposase
MDEMLPPPTPVTDAESSRTIGHRSARGASVEVLVRGEPRRAWTLEQKRDIVAESLGPDLTPSEVAQKYRISSGLLYTWRQQIMGRPGDSLIRSAPSFAQVEMATDLPQPQAPTPPPHCTLPTRSEGLIEIILPDGVSLRVDAQVNVKALRRVLDALRGQ